MITIYLIGVVISFILIFVVNKLRVSVMSILIVILAYLLSKIAEVVEDCDLYRKINKKWLGEKNEL